MYTRTYQFNASEVARLRSALQFEASFLDASANEHPTDMAEVMRISANGARELLQKLVWD